MPGEISTQPNHIHILFDAPPQINLFHLYDSIIVLRSRQVERCRWRLSYKARFFEFNHFLCLLFIDELTSVTQLAIGILRIIRVIEF